MGLGTLVGGWRIVRTMGSRITRLHPVQGFCAEAGGAMTLFLVTYFGIPVSRLHDTHDHGRHCRRRCRPQDRRRALERSQRRRRGLDRDASRGGIVRSRFLRALQISFLTRLRRVTLLGGIGLRVKEPS
jgi:hypothetical protein